MPDTSPPAAKPDVTLVDQLPRGRVGHRGKQWGRRRAVLRQLELPAAVSRSSKLTSLATKTDGLALIQATHSLQLEWLAARPPWAPYTSEEGSGRRRPEDGYAPQLASRSVSGCRS